MSHLAVIETKIRSLEVARLAAQHLGIPIVEDAKHVATWYRQENGQQQHPCDLVFGYSYWHFNLGLRQQPDGSYALVGDNYDVSSQIGATHQGVDHEGQLFHRQDLHGWGFLQKFGPNMGDYETRAGAGGQVGHFMTGRPTTFLKEYALQCAGYVAHYNGMHVERMPATDELDDAQPGAEKLRITGGYLPKHLAIHVVGQPDGTARMWVEGGTDNTCYIHTRPFEDALGQILGDIPLADLAHQRVGGQVRHIARAGR